MHQPFVHDLSVVVRAPNQAWSGLDGQMQPAGLHGVYVGDTRVARVVRISTPGHELACVSHVCQGGAETSFRYLVRLDERDREAVVVIDRHRRVEAGGFVESYEVVSGVDHDVTLDLVVEIVPDDTPLIVIRNGGIDPAAPEAGAAPQPGGERAPVALECGSMGPSWQWREATRASLSVGDARVSVDDGTVRLTWHLTLAPGTRRRVGWALDTADHDATLLPARQPFPLRADRFDLDPRTPAGRLLTVALADLDGLWMSTAARPDAAFLAAGAPWYLTLFGRDSLVAAGFLVPFTTVPALETLRSLAALQGTTRDDATGERPGKIPHEVRRETQVLTDGTTLPPVYYGTIDATLLWVRLLHAAWRHGAPEAEVVALLDHLVAALDWLRDDADPTGTGFVRYVDESGHALVNQGWKDSRDSARFADGRLAHDPIALVEVQAYAYAAARAGADLLRALGRTGAERARADELESYAAGLAERFRAAFWVRDARGPFLAQGLDGDDAPLDSATATMGHVLGTGLLTRDEEGLVVDRLLQPDLASGFGLRTLSSEHPAYRPLAYHLGSVWPHDTALVVSGLMAAGFAAEAAEVAAGLLAAADAFGSRLPELYGGDPGFAPQPYPFSCLPQAWAAASAVPILQALGELPYGD